ncbi:phosphatidylinositol glycan class A [Klebsormidium nitens]|uniref:phosphatidylinositol N-acetylglucosaminyltransferase n=1 Tax=Klebsormidium nitens TaxID=105231 RepID=A0A1Y1IKF5_KLENI|nr:phosphatidylinositol glycan class A [Klebsormidium nitens]|eukprot:GAQ89246.1 phosphatidylinositol glycan class A [Klebsormidium nitens]
MDAADDEGGETLCDGRQRHRILMVSDFFYPNFGGVENHIYYLSQCLLQRGHKVVVLTHAYGNRSGVRWMTNGLKVYYIPRLPFYCQSTFPTIYSTLPIVRVILIRERISVIHGHQAFSCLAHEAMLHGRTLGYKVAFTDHSLFGFADGASIHMNKVLKFVLADVHHAICVSHTSKENTALRSGLPPHRISVIPNAVDTAVFRPDVSKRQPGRVTIIVLSRLVYRKGIDLLVEVIPAICKRHPEVHFVIGGDGPKRVSLEEMRERCGLQERVEMLGEVPHADARAVLTRGHIFLNSSLTEAFCIAILEAASCGLLTVSTRVGGVPEVLPPDMIVLAEPRASELVEAVSCAITLLPTIDPAAMHKRVREMYSWHDVAARTERVYSLIVGADPGGDLLLNRLARYYACGPWAGKLFCAVALLDYVLCKLLDWWAPAESIDLAPDFPVDAYLKHQKGKG